MQLAAVSLERSAAPFIAQSFTVSQTIHFSSCCLTSYRILPPHSAQICPLIQRLMARSERNDIVIPYYLHFATGPESSQELCGVGRPFVCLPSENRIPSAT